MDALYLWLLAGLFMVGFGALVPPVKPASDQLWPSEMGYLRRGAEGVVRAVLASLWSERLISIGRRGIRRTSKEAPAQGDPFRDAIYAELDQPTGLRELMAWPEVRAARAEMTGRLIQLGLVPGPVSKWLGRTSLAAVPILALVGLITGHVGMIGFAISVLAGLTALRLSRLTFAGHRVSIAVRGLYRELAGKLERTSFSTRGWYTDVGGGYSDTEI